VLQVRVHDCEVACVHGGCEFVTVGTVTDEGADETGAVDWLIVVLVYSDRGGS